MPDTDDDNPIEAVYEDRNLLVCALVEAVSDGVLGGRTPGEEHPDEWAIVWLQTPMGQLLWHVPRELAEGLLTRNDAYEYNGHNRRRYLRDRHG